MFKRINRNKKGQNTAEYALLIALVVAAIIAMQTYAQRSLQGRIRDAGKFLTSQTSSLGATDQYEPYYLQSNYAISRDMNQTQQLDKGVVSQLENSTRNRDLGGFQQSNYGNFGEVLGH